VRRERLDAAENDFAEGDCKPCLRYLYNDLRRGTIVWENHIRWLAELHFYIKELEEEAGR
jgi:hypothetical protein